MAEGNARRKIIRRKSDLAGVDVWFGPTAEDLPHRLVAPLDRTLFASYTGPDCGLRIVHQLELNKLASEANKNSSSAGDKAEAKVGNSPPVGSTDTWLAGSEKWNMKNRKAYGICMSLYDQHPVNGKISGDPIADSFGLCARHNNALLVVADGVNWGEKPKLAARCAVYGCIQHVNNELFGSNCATLKSTSEIFPVLMRSLKAAHDTILRHEGGLTTLCVALVCPLKDIPNQYVVCVVNVGDSLAFVFSKRHGIREITTGSHDIRAERDIRDAGGALGPARGSDPELHNLTCSMTCVDAGDVVFLTSDGISDNFDPVVTKIAVAKKTKREKGDTVRYKPSEARASNTATSENSAAEKTNEQENITSQVTSNTSDVNKSDNVTTELVSSKSETTETKPSSEPSGNTEGQSGGLSKDDKIAKSELEDVKNTNVNNTTNKETDKTEDSEIKQICDSKDVNAVDTNLKSDSDLTDKDSAAVVTSPEMEVKANAESSSLSTEGSTQSVLDSTANTETDRANKPDNDIVNKEVSPNTNQETNSSSTNLSTSDPAASQDKNDRNTQHQTDQNTLDSTCSNTTTTATTTTDSNATNINGPNTQVRNESNAKDNSNSSNNQDKNDQNTQDQSISSTNPDKTDQNKTDPSLVIPENKSRTGDSGLALEEEDEEEDEEILPDEQMDGKPVMAPHERHRYAVKEMERVVHEFELFTELSCSAQELCGALLQHVLKLTDPKRKVLENPRLYGRRLKPEDREKRDSEIMARLARSAGKLDHATIIGYEVGVYHGDDDDDDFIDDDDDYGDESSDSVIHSPGVSQVDDNPSTSGRILKFSELHFSM